MRRKLAQLRKAVLTFVWKDDELGLAPRPSFSFTVNAKTYEFLTDDKKVEAFNTWLKGQIDAGLLQVKGAGTDTAPWTAKYVESAYKKGLVRAYADSNKFNDAAIKNYVGGQSQFLKDAFAQPEQLSKVKLLATRSFEGMKGITADIGAKLNNILAEGMARGDGPGEIASRMSKQIDSIGKKRAFVLARTEIIHAHAEGQLDGFEDLGIEELEVDLEFGTAGDDRVCPICAGMSGKIYTTEEARGVIPVHPQCRCAWLPYFGPKKSRSAVKKVKQAQKDAKLQADLAEAEAAQRAEIERKAQKLAQQLAEQEAAKAARAKAAAEAAAKKAAEEAEAAAKAAEKAAATAARKAAEAAANAVPAGNKPIVADGLPKGGTFAGSNLSVSVDTSVSLGGSTGAKKVVVYDGKSPLPGSWVMKQYNGKSDQARNEFVANALYDAFGKKAGAPESKLALVDGNTAVFNKFVPKIKTFGELGSVEQAAAIQKAQQNFVADAFLANWDVAGLSLDNLAVDSAGNVIRLDNGGALLYRAQGSPKGALFGGNVTELETLRNASKNPAAAKIFGSITDEQLLAQLEDFTKGNIQYVHKKIRAAVESGGFDAATEKQLKKTLNLRYNDLLAQKANLKAKIAAKGIAPPAPAAPVLKPTPTTKAKKAATAAKPVAPGSPRPAFTKSPGRVVNQSSVRAFSDRETILRAFIPKDPTKAKLLTGPEKSAVRNFTGSGSGMMKSKVLKNQLDDSVKHLDSALDKLPGWNGLSFRGIGSGMPQKAWDQYTSGNWAQVWWKSYSSTSIDPGSAFGTGYSGEGVTFIIKNKGKQGGYVEPISAVTHERELLMKRDSVFRVVGWSEETDQFYGKKRYLIIEEPDDDSPIPEQQIAPRRYTLAEIQTMIDTHKQKAGLSKYIETSKLTPLPD